METQMIRCLSTGQKIALWIAFAWVLFILLGAIGNGWYIILVVCIALLIAILCLIKNKLDAKYAWAVFAVSLILPVVMFHMFVDPKDESSKQGIDNREQSKKVIKSEDTSKTTDKQTDKVEKKQNPQLSPKEQEIAVAGDKQGTMFGMAGASNDGFSNMLDMADYVEGMDDKVNVMFEEMAGGEYDKQYGAPSNAEERKLKKIYIEHFVTAMKKTMDAMDN